MSPRLASLVALKARISFRLIETILASLLLLTLFALILVAAWAAFLTCAIVAGFAFVISFTIPRERPSSPSAEKAVRRRQPPAPQGEAAADGEAR